MTEPARHDLAFAVSAMKGRVLAHSPSVGGVSFAGAASDSREVTRGRLFFALPGERVNGFDFCAAAAEAGAAAVVVAQERGRPSGCDALPVIAVPNPRLALGDLARAVRDRFAGKVVGVTGSNGKTTTKELIAAALGSVGPTLRTAGNRNTEVGLPLTVLEASGQEAFWVLEMAMRARGEIAALAAIARPHVGLVTNVAAAHLERLGTLLEVARAKGEIFHGLEPNGIAVLPVDEPLLEKEAAHLPESRKRRFGGCPPERASLAAPRGVPARALVRVLDFTPAGPAGSVVRLAVGEVPVVVRLPLAGEHNARNASAALTVVAALGLPIAPAAAALERASLPPHRSRIVSFGGRMVLDDCYNANPASMSAALQTIAASSGVGRAFAVLGDMLEVGPETEALHHALGREVGSRGLAGLAAVGAQAQHLVRGAEAAGMSPDRLLATTDPEAAAVATAGWSAAGDWILVKASRGVRLEQTMEALERLLGAGAAAPVEKAEVEKKRSRARAKSRKQRLGGGAGGEG